LAAQARPGEPALASDDEQRTMSELQQRPEEAPESWLRRLERIDPADLPPDLQRTLALSIGYARFLARKHGAEADRGLPEPEWVVSVE
jgi:hypothetical protein